MLVNKHIVFKGSTAAEMIRAALQGGQGGGSGGSASAGRSSSANKN